MGYLIGDDMALLHSPKTAGLWTRKACQVVGLRWQRFGDQHQDDPPPDDRWTMMFIRHPLQWLKSFWMFHERTGWDQYTDGPGFIFYACHRNGEDFPAFVSRYLDKMPGAIGRMFARYERHADAVGKVEDIVTDLKLFIRQQHPELNLTQIDQMSPRNVSPDVQRQSVRYGSGQDEAVCRAEHEFMREHRYA